MAITRRHVAIGAASGAVLAAAVSFIGPLEGLKLVASHNSFDPPGTIDVCYGNTKAADLPDLQTGDRFTKAECDSIFAEKLQTYDGCLVEHLKPEVYKALPLQRHVALISFVYNLGCGKLKSSGIAARLNAGDVPGACGRIKPYVYANHVVLRGLVTRRVAEYDRCMSED